MPILSVILATIVMLFGLRLVITALQTAFTGKILVRKGLRRSEWQPAANQDNTWKIALRDGLMGVLLIVLGLVLLF